MISGFLVQLARHPKAQVEADVLGLSGTPVRAEGPCFSNISAVASSGSSASSKAHQISGTGVDKEDKPRQVGGWHGMQQVRNIGLLHIPLAGAYTHLGPASWSRDQLRQQHISHSLLHPRTTHNEDVSKRNELVPSTPRWLHCS